MENQATINRESWKETLTILLHPAVIIPIIIGFGAALLVFNTDDNYWKMILTAVSSIGLGIGVNYFTFFFKDNTKYNKLLLDMNEKDKKEAVMEKELHMFAKTSVQLLMSMTNNLLAHCHSEKRRLNTFEKKMISDIAILIKSYEEYYKPDFSADLSEFIRLAPKIDNEPNENEKQYLIFDRDNYGYLFNIHKVPEYMAMTGSYSLEDATFKSIYNPTNDSGSKNWLSY